MTPADELRAAAAKLREMADDLGEWRYDDGNTMVRDRNGDIVAVHVHQGDGAWIALMGPGKAEPLAVWLDEAAGPLDLWNTTLDAMNAQSRAAVLFARAVLGEKP